jgi:hypothetical protein
MIDVSRDPPTRLRSVKLNAGEGYIAPAVLSGEYAYMGYVKCIDNER